MTIANRVGIVGGNGWIASALVRAAVTGGIVDPARLILSSRSGSKGSIADLNVHWTLNNDELVERSDIVVLSVRPEQFGHVQIDLRDKLVISVMAAISCESIAEKTRAERIVRAVPNAAAAISRSFTPWYANKNVSVEDKTLVQEFFDASGEAAEVLEEFHLDYCSGMTGSGAAFPALLVEAMIADATKQGLPRAFAERAAKGVVCGASQLFAGVSGDTAAIVKEMIDYRGTIAAALQTMLDHGFMEAVSSGLRASSLKVASIASGKSNK